MIEVENMDYWGFKYAVMGMRNSHDSWDKSDSFYCGNDYVLGERCDDCIFYTAVDKEHGDCTKDWFYGAEYLIGENDLELMRKLIKTGSSHRKFLRQIFVSMDITAPLYWWKEFDTYKIGVTANSCSTMHTIHKKEFTLDDFSSEHLNFITKDCLRNTIKQLNICREYYRQNKDKDDWYQMIQLLPSSYNQKRTVTMNYENILNIIEQRSNHRLDEWKMLITALKNLPYVDKLFVCGEE